VAENKFQLTLTAVDKASKVVNDVNKSVNRLFRPFDNATKSVRSFSNALGRNDLVKRPLWALEKIGRGVTMFGNTFGVAESTVLGGSARIASALGMIGGPIGGLLAGTAAAAGGAAAVSVKMAQMGQDITRTARGLNISTDSLQLYRKAAEQAGLQTETMDAALAALGSSLYGADAGTNQPLAAALQFARISVKQTKDGAVDTLGALLDIADVVKRMPDQVQARQFTDMLGVSDLLPLLRKGREGIEEYLREAKKLGIMSPKQVEQNDAQADAWNRTKTAMDSAAVSVGNLIAKYLDLNQAAAATTSLAKRLQGDNNFAGTAGTLASHFGRSVWNNLPFAWPLRQIFGEMGPDGGTRGSRSATGTVTNISGGSWAPSTGGNSPVGIRNNNPGNLRSWAGAERVGGFARFPTPEAGLTAMGKNLLGYQDRYGLRTISGIVNRWAPSADGNNVSAYESDVSKQTGFGIDQPLNLHDPKTLQSLMTAMTRHENGQQPYTPEQLASAIANALRDAPLKIEVSGAPAGMQFRAGGGGKPSLGVILAPGGMS
jgi:hypothetical protein